MGSTSDLPIVEKAVATLKEYGVDAEARVLSDSELISRQIALEKRLNT